MASLTEQAKTFLAKLGASPRKKLGQHFMVDEHPLDRMVDALDLQPGEDVLEIGPGLGFLTEKLIAKGVKVHAVEMDDAYARALPEKFGSDVFTLVYKDILKYSISESKNLKTPVKVIGNIPYNITSPILEWLIKERTGVKCAVLTMQWEVAERLAASPGTKEWGPLSIFVQFHATVEILGKISRHAFFPPPKVDSASIKLTWRKPLIEDPQIAERFFKFMQGAFQKRRKMLLNALPGEKSENTALLKKAAIDPNIRPERLTLEEWVRLAHV